MSADTSWRRPRARSWRSAAAVGLALLLAWGPAGPAGEVAALPAPLQQPQWQAGWFLPTGDSLPPDRERPPSVVGFSFQIDPPAGWSVTWTGEVTANGQTLPEEAVEVPGGRQLFYRLDPCAVAGSDLPGTEVTLSWDLSFKVSHPQLAFDPPPANGSRVLRLGPDTAAPLIADGAEPPAVQPGQTVRLVVGALDDSSVSGPEPAWDSGLRYLGLTDRVSRQVHQPGVSQPEACAEKITAASQTFDYAVPADALPGQELRLFGFAEDWAGNQAERELLVLVAGEAPSADELLVEREAPSAEAPPAEEPPDEEPPAGPDGGSTGQSPSGGGTAPLFEPDPACPNGRPTSMRFQGLNNRCDGWLSICGRSIPIACPYTNFSALAVSEPGPTVCCDRWRQAVESGQPCDVLQDLDCDGIPNQQDTDPFRSGSPPPRQRGALLPDPVSLLSLLTVPAEAPSDEACRLPWLAGR